MSTDLRQWFAAAAVAGITAVTVFVMPCAANAEPPNVEPQSVPYAVQRIGNPTPPAAPLRPFYDNMSVLNSARAVGPARGKLAITNLTLTNFDTSAQQVFIFAPLFAAGGTCGSPVIGGTAPQMTVYVQPQQTLVIPYPTPLVVERVRPNCIAAEVTTTLHGGSVQVDVTGYAE